MDKTYIEVCKNDKRDIQLNIWKNDGTSFSPSAAYYEIKGAERDNVIVSKSPASVDNNKVYFKITTSVTASAALYDIYWELHKETGVIDNHCTKLMVLETC
jgi:hypothetical protein